MWQQVYATSRSGKRYVKQWVNTSTGQTISNRQYQQHFGSVAKAGFSTIERKTAVSSTARESKTKTKTYPFRGTKHTIYTLDANGNWEQQTANLVARDASSDDKVYLSALIIFKGVERWIQTRGWLWIEYQAAIDEMIELLEKYEAEMLKLELILVSRL